MRGRGMEAVKGTEKVAVHEGWGVDQRGPTA